MHLERCVQRLAALGDERSAYWEPTLFNLGLAYRRLGQLEAATRVLEAALEREVSASSEAALGLTWQLRGHFERAVERYTHALALQSDEPVATAMLPRALDDLQKLVDFVSGMTV